MNQMMMNTSPVGHVSHVGQVSQVGHVGGPGTPYSRNDKFKTVPCKYFHR